LNGYNYSQEGKYYVTICTRGRKTPLSKIETNGRVGLASTLTETAKPILSRIGEIVDCNWKELPNQFTNVVIDEYVVMSNHIC